jgi:hypothetical protein
VRSAFVPSIAMIYIQSSQHLLEGNKEFEQVLTRWILFSKVRYAMVVGDDGA